LLLHITVASVPAKPILCGLCGLLWLTKHAGPNVVGGRCKNNNQKAIYCVITRHLCYEPQNTIMFHPASTLSCTTKNVQAYNNSCSKDTKIS